MPNQAKHPSPHRSAEVDHKASSPDLPPPPPHPVFCPQCHYTLGPMVPAAMVSVGRMLTCPECGDQTDPATEPEKQRLRAQAARDKRLHLLWFPVGVFFSMLLMHVGQLVLMFGVPLLLLASPRLAFAMARETAWHEAFTTPLGGQAFDRQRIVGKTVLYATTLVVGIVLATIAGLAVRAWMLQNR